MHLRGLLALGLLTGCAAAPAPAPATPAHATTAAPAAAAEPKAHTTISDRADALREAAGLLDKAEAAKGRGNRSYAEQLFSSAELIVGPEALATIAQLFREGAPPRIQTPLTTLPMSTPRQPATAGDSQADEPDEKPKRGSLAGVVKLDGAALGDMPAVITLEPADGRFRRRAPRSAIMEQRGREFAPHILTVPRGSTVTFPNFDSIYHNVFSRSGAAPFDLGIYRSGQARSYVFDKEGIVHLGCNLHRNMSAYVVVVSEPHYVISDAKGRFRFRSLEPGRYKARVWTEKSEPVTRELTVAPEENQVTFELHARPAEPDVDKFGAAR